MRAVGRGIYPKNGADCRESIYRFPVGRNSAELPPVAGIDKLIGATPPVGLAAHARLRRHERRAKVGKSHGFGKVWLDALSKRITG